MNAGTVDRRLRGVAEPQSAEDDVEVGTDRLGEAEARERLLGHGKQARHQELVAELYLVHVDIQGRLDPPAQTDDPHAGLGPVEFLEACTHDAPPTRPQYRSPRAARQVNPTDGQRNSTTVDARRRAHGIEPAAP